MTEETSKLIILERKKTTIANQAMEINQATEQNHLTATVTVDQAETNTQPSLETYHSKPLNNQSKTTSKTAVALLKSELLKTETQVK